ncbi:MAG: ferritin-like domain-containing protein [Leptospiraceae bacterium]|nr:ferritin-like domain-containing protein [Leptospiraceae bacterium]
MATILDITDMASRNVKVAWDLFPSAFSGYLMQEGRRDQIDIKSQHGIHYDWKYSNFGNPEFQKLYTKAKKGQWDADDLAWDTNVDPQNFEMPIFPEKLQPMFGTDMYRKVDQKKKQEMLHSTIAWLLSQFLHGEQGALHAAAMTVEATPWMGAKYYGSTQVMDEARHVEVFYKYIDTKLHKLYNINDNLFVVIHALTSTGDWDLKFLGMQIMIEGLALGAFGLIYKLTKEPLLRELLKQVISDESRHVHYGVEALRDFYTKECPEHVRRDREDWAYEVSIMLRNRFLFTEFHEEYFGHTISRENWVKMVVESDIMSEFRISLFSRLIPNLKAIGLLSDRIKPKYEALGLLRYQDGKSADNLSLNELLS